VNVVDSSGWIEYFGDGPNEGFFAPPIQQVGSAVVPSICIFEVFRWVLRHQSEEEAVEAEALMRQGLVVPLDEELAIEAAAWSVDTDLPMADSIVLATARAYDATLWTQDAHFRDMEGVKYIEKRKKTV
jgi:predicted nucleic acid-binding protein